MGRLISSKEWDIRHGIFDALQHGRLEPKEAEARALELGVGPLVEKPDATHFDPMKRDSWTLSMTVAWIAFRDLDKVRDMMDDWRAVCPYWRFRELRLLASGYGGVDIQSGWWLVDLEPINLAVLKLGEAIEGHFACEDPPKLMTFEAAQAELWSKLGQHLLSAAAVEQPTGRIRLIPAIEWPYLSHFTTGNADEIRRNDMWDATYTNLTFGRAEVLLLWPRCRVAKPERQKCRAWLKEIIAPSRDVKKCTQVELAIAARKKFGVGPKQFKALWTGVTKELRAPAWNRAGRPKKIGPN